MTDTTLECTCGKVKGIAKNVGPKSGNHVICYCDDCQAFGHYLNRADEILNERGGTEIYQMPPAFVEITEGANQIRCMRLTPKGLNRWYTECCKTPIGNALSANWAFIGIIHNFFLGDSATRETCLGPIQGEAFMAYAKDASPEEKKKAKISFPLLVKTLYRVLSWRLKGLNKPSPVFDFDGNPVSEPIVLNPSSKN